MQNLSNPVSDSENQETAGGLRAWRGVEPPAGPRPVLFGQAATSLSKFSLLPTERLLKQLQDAVPWTGHHWHPTAGRPGRAADSDPAAAPARARTRTVRRSVSEPLSDHRGTVTQAQRPGSDGPGAAAAGHP